MIKKRIYYCSNKPDNNTDIKGEIFYEYAD
nr:MAG TPA: hypothetical protein [Bacteriophage sp.]